MKKLILLVAVIMAVGSVSAQTPFKVDKDGLVKAIERTDKEIANEKRATRGQTWLDRAQAMYNAGGVLFSQMYQGQPKEDLFQRVGKNENPTVKMLNNQEYQLLSYPFADVYLAGDVVQFWEEKEEVYPGAADKAFEAYKKAGELDSKLAPKAKEGISNVANIFRLRATTAYNLGKQDEAAENFIKSYQVVADPLVNEVDTNSIFNAGYLYVIMEKYDKGIPILEEAMSKDIWGDEGSIPYFLSYAFMKTDQMDKAKDVLLRGREKFPNSKNITEGLINYYSITQSDFMEIKDVLEQALAEDPSNLIVWNGLGQAYVKGGDIDASIDYFTKFAQAFPNDFQAQYYLGDMWIEKGNALLEEAQAKEASMSNAEQEAAMENVLDAYRKSWAPLVKAYELNPGERAVVQRLARISYRLIDDAGMEAQFNKFNDLYESMISE